MKLMQFKIGTIEKVALVLFLFSIAAIPSISYYVGDILATYGQDMALSTMRHDAEAKMENFDRFMNERIVDLSMLSAKGSIISDPSKPAGAKLAYLHEFERISMAYASISIYDANGSLIADTRSLGAGLDQSSLDQVRIALSGKTYSSPKPVVSATLHVPVMYVSVPFYGDDGKVSGAIVASVLSTRLGEVFGLTENDRVEVVDSEGTVVYAAYDREEELVEKSDLLTFAEIDMARSARSTASIAVVDGKSMLHVTAGEKGFQNYPDNGWLLIAEQDRDPALKPVDDIRNRASLFSGLIVALVFVIIFFIINSYFVRPMREFTRVASELEKSNYSARVNIRSNDEIGEFANVFNRAMGRIEEVEAEHSQMDKAKTQFLSITSHELRSPMTPMKAQLQMLEQGYLGKMNRAQKGSLDIVIRNADRLDRILVDFLEISRIEAARLKFEFRKTDLAKITQDVIIYMGGYMPEKHVRIKSSIKRLPIIDADPDRVSQVLRNLIGNAIKFSPANGMVEVGAHMDGRFILFSVKDHGIGISPENQKKLFEPFFQVDKTFSRAQQGTGLGLAICRGIVESQNGKIWLESREGKGTTFYFTLPFEPVREMKQIRVLFSSKSEADDKLKGVFKDFLGPLGEQEFTALHSSGNLSKKAVLDYIDDVLEKGIITKDEAERFKSALPEGI